MVYHLESSTSLHLDHHLSQEYLLLYALPARLDVDLSWLPIVVDRVPEAELGRPQVPVGRPGVSIAARPREVDLVGMGLERVELVDTCRLAGVDTSFAGGLPPVLAAREALDARIASSAASPS